MVGKRTLILMIVALGLLLFVAAPAAAAPDIRDLTPPPGAAVAGPEVTVEAYVDGAVDDHEVSVGGQAATSEAQSAGSRTRITAQAQVGHGHHMVEMAVDGVQRRWRIGVSTVGVERLSGADRYATAAQISRDSHPSDRSVAAVVLARGDDFADGLAGAPLATEVGGPLLLSSPDALPAATEDELQRVLSHGGTVHLLGGRAALSQDVEDAIADMGFRTERHAGDSRHGTAAEISRQLPEPSGVVLASGRGFADALAVAGSAAEAGHPILLTEREALPEETAEALADVSHVTAVGGGAAITDDVLRAVGDIGASVQRVSGADRYATAEAIADRFGADGAPVMVSSGHSFADALAGGPHVAARGGVLLLAAPAAFPQGAGRIEGSVTVYGGAQAVDDASIADMHTEVLSRGGPTVTGVSPEPRSTVSSLERMTVELDAAVERFNSPMYVTVDGREVPGRTVADSERSLTFEASGLPQGIEPGNSYPVVVQVAAYRDGTWRHHTWQFTLRRPYPVLGRGDSGEAVRALQRTLHGNGYWLGSIDGRYGQSTQHAVFAFQKARGLPRTGRFDAATRRALEADPSAPRARSSSGSLVEIDLERQLMYVVRGGDVRWAFHISAGHGQAYQFQGRTYVATTTTGRQQMNRHIDGVRVAERGELYRPKYFDDTRGIAVHGYPSVPTTAASSGCVRVSNAAMDAIWSEGMMPLGSQVWVYPHDHYR